MLTQFPYLTAKPLCEFTPEEYAAYVRSLFVAPIRKSPVADLTAKLTPSGKVSLTNKRKPQWILRSEITAIAKELNRPENEVWNYAKKRKFEILTQTPQTQT